MIPHRYLINKNSIRKNFNKILYTSDGICYIRSCSNDICCHTAKEEYVTIFQGYVTNTWVVANVFEHLLNRL